MNNIKKKFDSIIRQILKSLANAILMFMISLVTLVTFYVTYKTWEEKLLFGYIPFNESHGKTLSSELFYIACSFLAFGYYQFLLAVIINYLYIPLNFQTLKNET